MAGLKTWKGDAAPNGTCRFPPATRIAVQRVSTMHVPAAALLDVGDTAVKGRQTQVYERARHLTSRTNNAPSAIRTT